MLRKIMIFFMGITFIMSTAVMAQWPNAQMHYPQLPDLIGWDVDATAPIELADDWQCTQSAIVKDIHFWGSWKNQDGIPQTDEYESPMPVFTITIYSDLPVGHPQNPYSYSIPGDILWGPVVEAIPGVPSEPPTLEGWMDTWQGTVINNDHIPYWQYDYILPEGLWFPEDQGTIYWLGIRAELQDPVNFQWGWKNSRDHFNDDAVYRGPAGEWVEMYEPPRYNFVNVYFNEFGEPLDQGSTNYYGQGWYFYPEFSWSNIWFYNNPFTYDHQKEIFGNINIDPVGPNPEVTFAINYSTPEWSDLGFDRPPLPSDFNNPPFEEDYIIREVIPVTFGPNPIQLSIPWNPEWVSIDIIATDVIIVGDINHECVQTSLDLSFVITGDPVTGVPTLGQWGMLLLLLLLIVAATVAIVRRRKEVIA